MEIKKETSTTMREYITHLATLDGNELVNELMDQNKIMDDLVQVECDDWEYQHDIMHFNCTHKTREIMIHLREILTKDNQ